MLLLVSLHDFNIEQRGAQYATEGIPQNNMHLCTTGGSDITQIDDMPPTKP
jgi:hypothetical protein